jgi:hypothetical protein
VKRTDIGAAVRACAYGAKYVLTCRLRGKAPPLIRGLVLTNRCNLRCRHCRVHERGLEQVRGTFFYFHTPYYGRDDLHVEPPERRRAIEQLLLFLRLLTGERAVVFTNRVPSAAELRPRLEGLDAVGLYLHIPFCERICPYCPYNKELYSADLARRYAAAVGAEADFYAGLLGRKPVTSLYIGGGTPTTMLDSGLDGMVGHLRCSGFRIRRWAEPPRHGATCSDTVSTGAGCSGRGGCTGASTRRASPGPSTGRASARRSTWHTDGISGCCDGWAFCATTGSASP